MSVYNMAGGGAALNVKVVGGTSAPGNPRENTVWVNTDVAITEWVFAATQPTMRLDGTALCGGEVWFNSGTVCAVPMNVLKKNGIYAYPVSCMQYVGGIWTPKTAKTYQNGAWVDWDVFYFRDGEQFPGITGGWSGTGWTYSSYSVNTPTIGDTIGLVVSKASTCCTAGADVLMDLSAINTLHVSVINKTGSADGYLGVYSSKNAFNSTIAQVVLQVSGDLTLDVSDVTSGYLCVRMIGTSAKPSGTVTVTKIWGSV